MTWPMVFPRISSSHRLEGHTSYYDVGRAYSVPVPCSPHNLLWLPQSQMEMLPTWENTVYRGDVRTTLKAMAIGCMLWNTNPNAEKYISANNDTYCIGKCGVGYGFNFWGYEAFLGGKESFQGFFKGVAFDANINITWKQDSVWSCHLTGQSTSKPVQKGKTR